MTNEEFLRIHKELHSNLEEIVVQDTPQKVYKNNGFKSVNTRTGYQFRQQNIHSGSPYAKMARDGDKITWYIGPKKTWGLVINDEVITPIQ